MNSQRLNAIIISRLERLLNNSKQNFEKQFVSTRDLMIYDPGERQSVSWTKGLRPKALGGKLWEASGAWLSQVGVLVDFR